MCNEVAVDVYLAAIDGSVGCDDVLQCGLQDLICVRCRQRRIAVQVCRYTAVSEIVVVEILLERKVTYRIAAGVSYDSRHFLGDIVRHDPGLDRVFARRLDQVVQFLTRCRIALGSAIIDRDTPATEPLDIAEQPQVDRRFDATGVESRRARARLELPQGDLRAFVTVAARCDRAVDEAQRLGVYEQWI